RDDLVTGVQTCALPISCYYRTYCAGKEPTKDQKDIYATALRWLYDSIKAVKVGATTKDIASKWPSAKEAWGYEEEDQAAANLWEIGRASCRERVEDWGG